MFYRIEPYLALVLMFGTTAFAAWKGSAPERLGTVMIMVAWVAMLVVAKLAHPFIPVMTFLALDGLLAFGFLVVAVRYSSLWLGAAMICQAILFGAHALRLSDSGKVLWGGMDAYIVVSNFVGFLVLFILIGGTFATIARRRRADREKVEDRARIVKRPDWLTDATPPTADAL
jgi:predicted neutral ceramidase superfamily lipid hydrolase